MYDPRNQLPIEDKVRNTPDAHQLIATDRIIEMARRLGINFGHGDPHERIRYFIKLGILPHAVRKTDNQSTVNSQLSTVTSGLPAKASATAGHLPYWTLKRLIVIDRLKRSGASFTQIAEKFKRIDNLKAKEQSTTNNQQLKPALDNGSAIKNALQSSVALWGSPSLSEEKIEEKLKIYKQEIDKKLQSHKAEIKKELGIANQLTDTKDIVKSLSESDLNNLTGYQNYLKKDPQPFEPDPKTLKTISEDFTSLEENTSGPIAELQNSNHRSVSKPLFTTAFATILIFFIVLGILQSPSVKQALDKANLDRANQIATETSQNSEKLGAVLAASSEANKLYIDATTEFLGNTTFLDPITAPNIIYGLTGGTGIAVTAGQNPVVSLDSTEIVTTVNSTSGALTLKGSGATSVSTSGSTITISSSSSSSGDITAVNAGNGLTGGGSSDDVTLAVSLSTSGTSSTTSSASGLQFSSGLSLLRGCTNTQTLQWIAATATWDCATGGGSSSFTLSGDSGSDQTLSSGDTIEIAGGTNGIDTVAGATDTITLNFDSTEVGTTSWGSASAVVWTFNAGTVDPTIDFNDGSVIFNEGGSDIDLRAEGDNNANLFTLDAGLFSGVGQISLGAAAQSTATAFFVVDNPATTATSNQNFYKTYIDNNAAVTITGSTTSSIVASLAIDEPNITATGTATNGVTLYLSGAPTEGSSGNFALWVDDGQSRFENTPVAGSTTGSAVAVVPTYVVEATDITLSGIRLALDSNSNADPGDIFYGLNIDDFTTTSGPTEYGVRIGSGYDYQFYFELGTRDLRVSATAPSAGTSPLTATIPALAADDTFCLSTLANCFGAGGGAGVTYTSQVTNALTKFTATTGQITSSGITDDGSTLTLPANRSVTLTDGTGSITESFSPAGTTGTARALTITPKFGVDPTDQTLTGVYVNPNTNSNDDSGDVLNGILIDTITASPASEYALQIGSGWDQNIYLNDTSTNVLLADGGTITVTDGTNTLCTITDGGTTGALNCTGNITGGSGSTVGFWSRSSTTLSPATANDVVSISSNDTSNTVLALTSTGAAATPFTVTANSVTTGTVLGLSATALTTGEILDITGTWAPSNGSTNEGIDINFTHSPTGSADNFRGIELNIADATALANTVFGTHSTLALTGNEAKIGTGFYSDITTSSTTGDTLIGFDAFSASSTGGIIGGATTRNVYGVRSRPNIGAESTAGTTNVFGFYANATGDVADSGTFNAYGTYIANGTYDSGGTSTAYGLYVESITGADTNYSAYINGANTAGTDVLITNASLTTGVALSITSTGTGLTSGSLLNISSATTGAVATNGIVSLNATGNYTSTSNIGLLTVLADSTAAGTIQRISGNALTTGVGLSIASTGTGLTSGSLLNVSSATTGAVATNGIVSLNATGAYTSTSNIGLLTVLADSTTAGTIQRISGNALTTGVALSIASTGTGLTSGSLLNISSATTGTVATNGIVSLTATGAYTSTANVGLLNVVANSTQTGTIQNISGTGVTTGIALNIVGSTSTGITSGASSGFVNIATDVGSAGTTGSLMYLASDFSAGSATTAYGVKQAATDSTAIANTDYGYYTTLTLTGNAAKIGVGNYSDITTSSTTGDTLVAYDAFSASSTGGILAGATTRNVYGVRSRPNVGAESGAGTTNVFGFYANATGDVAASGTFNAYGTYIANGTYDTDGTSTAYGLYVESITGADNNYTAVFAGGNVGVGDTSPGAPLEVGDGTDSLQVSSVGDITFVDSNGGASITGPAGGALSILGGASQALTITAAAASTWGTSAGDITLDSGDEIVLADTDTLIIGGHAGDVAYNVISDSGGSPGAGAVNSDDDLYIEGDLELDGTSINAASATLVVSSCTGCGGGSVAWSAITAPTGDLNLTFDAGETNTFTLSETTDTLWTFTGTAFTTGEVFDISTTHAPADASTNEAIDINITHTPTVSADNFQSINLTTTDGTALANTVYGISNTLTLTGNEAKTGYGYYGTVTSSSTTADTLISMDLAATQSGASTSGTKNVYGIRNQPTVTGANTSTTVINQYGEYIVPTSSASTTATLHQYGQYIGGTAQVTGAGIVNRYGVYVANASMNTTGTSSQYGLYIADQTGADRNEEIRLASTTPTIAMTNAGILTFTDGTNNLFDITDGGTDTDINIWGNSGSAQSITMQYQDAGGSDAWLRTIIPVSTARLFEVMEASGANSVFMVGGSTFGNSFRYELTVGASGVITTSDVLTLTSDGLTTGSALVATGSTTTGVTDHFIKLASDVGSATALVNLAPDFSGSAVTAYGLRIAATDSTANANTDYGISNTLTLTGNIGKTGYGYYGTVTSSSTTADTIISMDLAATQSGAITSGTANVYGIRNQPTVTGVNTSSAIINQYGEYIVPTSSASTTATLNQYGQYIAGTAQVTGAGIVNRYGLYVANATMDATGTSTQYGIYVENNTGADTNYAGYFNIGNASSVYISSSLTTADRTTDAVTITQANDATNAFSGDLLQIDQLDSGASSSGDAIDVDMRGAGEAIDISHTPGGNSTGPSAIQITATFGIAGTDQTLTNIKLVNNTNGNTDTGDILIAIDIQNITSSSATETAIKLGSGFDYGICFDCDGTYTPTTVSGGIQWGTDATTANNIALFRSANGTATLELGDGTDLIAAAAATFSINLDDTTSRSERLCHGGGDAGTGVAAISDCSGTPGDYAEEYGSSDASLEAGDIVAVDPSRQSEEIIDDGIKGSKAWIVKSNSQYQQSVFGIVSTAPNEVIGRNFDSSENPFPVALNGRVPVKVSLENGPIKTGDPITSSSTLGVGMRATQPGRVIGIALESFPASQGEALRGKIMVFVNPNFYIPQTLADDLSILISQTQTQTGLLTQQAASLHALLAEDIARAETLLAQLENTHVPTEEEIASLVKNEVNKQLISLGYVDYEASGSAQASSSSALAAQTNKTLSDLDNLLATYHLSLNTLSVTGNTQLAQTQIAGTLSQDGTLIIDYGRQINVLGSTLYLQNDSLAGDTNCHSGLSRIDSGVADAPQNDKCGVLLDIGAGLLTVDNQGNLVATGNIEAKGIVLSESITNSTIGSSLIPAGSNSITIETSALKPNAKVLVTATGPTGGKSLYLAGKSDYENFTVAIENGPASNNIKFDWLIVNTTQITQNN